MKHVVATGQTNYTVLVWLADSSSSTGAGIASIAAADITVYYARVETDNDVTSAIINMSDLSALTDAHTDGGWYEVDGTNQPGLYRIDLPDAVFAAGAWSAAVTIIDAGSNNIAPANLEFQLEPVPANAVEISGDSSAADNLELDYDGTGYTKANSTIGTCTTNTDMRGTNSAALAATALSTAQWTNTRAGYLDELAAANIPADVDAILLDTGTDGVVVASINTGAITADAIAANAITSSELAQSAAQEIADELLARGVSNVEDTADATSLAALVLAAFESVISGTTWTIYKTDHSTTFTTRTVTTDSNADPIVEVT